MSIHFDLSQPHRVAAANSHYYKTPTEPLYLNRALQYHDLIYLTDGAWLFTENEIDYPLEKDDVLLLTAGHHHYTRLPCRAETHTVCLHAECLPTDRADTPGVLTLPTLLHARTAPAVKRCFEDIADALWSSRPHREERMAALFNLLVLELADLPDADANRPDLAAEIIRLINANPHRQYRIAEMAEQFYVSARTIENVMRRSVGMSFSKYQMNRKLEMAALQIEIEPDIRLSEIASMFGFCDEFHLSKAFKQKYGVAPLYYRREHIKKD